MNKKEVAEIKKLMKLEKHCIDNIVGCYVTPSKEKRIVKIQNISSMEDEHMQKFLDIFKKSLSGTIGCSLNCLSFSDKAEESDGTQNLLYEIEKDKLDDEERLNDLFDRIVNNYEDKGYYCILLMHGIYDVINKDSDEGDGDVYSHIICAICPVTISKPFLAYDGQSNEITDGPTSWTVAPPASAFLFPSFTDRMANIHEVLVYNKKSNTVNPEIIEGVLQCKIPASAEDQVNAFVASTQAAFENEVSYEQASSIHDALVEQMELSDEEQTLSAASIKNILEEEQASDLDAFEAQFHSIVGDEDIFLTNIINKDKFVVKMDGIVITATSETKDLISVKEIDGHKYLAISPNGDLEVNGLLAKP